ncbi:hypothetical protein PHYBOEH_002450 [Phytophthora boehmeriae]|uniref:ABC transporter domain-containing protein n=1 Tax=Phytophthora boehmeriae TaxID=109152 RepID=A0A8T1WR25_9STRA|nr:hypothetical protein PHYBOEH_002450 [Phytophthora boehmeriae]
MEDSAQPRDEISETGSQLARAALLKRNRHLQDTQMSSPAGFGGLGTRQFLQKQLMTPGSATSASSFEEGASYDGFSDAGTPGTDGGLTKSGTQHKFFVKAESAESGEAAQYVARSTKQPTKRLSSPSRESLARRIIGTSSETHGMVESEETKRNVDTAEDESTELPPSEVLTNLVVKRVPSLNISEIQSTGESVPLSPRQSTKVARRIVTSPRKTIRRRVVRTEGKDGKLHEVVQYVNAEGQVVENPGASFFDEETTVKTSTTLSSQTATSIVTPSKLTRRTLRRTGADGQVYEVVQYLDASGNIVRSEGYDFSAFESAPNSSSSTTISTPSKRIRRVVIRRTGADGQMHEEVQFLDADGNVVQSDGSALSKTTGTEANSTSDLATVTHRVVMPAQTLRRVVIRRTDADGQVYEEVQHLDADGNVVSSEGDGAPGSGTIMSEETLTEGPSSSRNVTTRRVVRRIVVGKDGSKIAVDQLVDAEGRVIEGEEGRIVRSASFAESVSSVASDSSIGGSTRRTITRRVVTPGRVVRHMIVNKAGSSSGAESEDEMYYDADGQPVSSEGREPVTSGSFTRSVRRSSTPTHRVTTRRVVTPQGITRRTVVHNRSSGSNGEDESDIDAEFVNSEGNTSSDESVGGSSRGGSRRGSTTVVTRRVVAPTSETRSVLSTSTAKSESNEASSEATQSVIHTTTSNASGFTTPNRAGLTIVTTPQEYSMGYFTRTEDENASNGVDSTVASRNMAVSNKNVDNNSAAATPDVAIRNDVVASPTNALNHVNNVSASVATAAGVITASTSLTSQEPAGGPEAQQPNDKEELEKNKTAVPTQSIDGHSAPAAGPTTEEIVTESRGGFWGFFGKTEPKEALAEDSVVQSNHAKSATASPAIEEDEVVVATTTGESPRISATQTNPLVDEAQQEVPDSSDYEVQSPEGTAPYVVANSDEVTAPLPSDDNVRTSIGDIPAPERTIKATAGPNDTNDGDAVEPVGIAATAAATSGKVLALTQQEDGLKYGEPHEGVAAGSAAPASAVNDNDLVADTPAASMAAESTEEDEAVSAGSRRKAGRSIWTFWGGRDKGKAQSPLSKDMNLKQEEQDEAAVVATAAITTVDSEEQNRHTPASSRDDAFVTAPTECIATTEVTQTTSVVVEEEVYPLVSPSAPDERRDNVFVPVEATASVADVEEVAHSQEPETHNATMNEKSAGFWGFFGKKDKSEEMEMPNEAATAAAVGAVAYKDDAAEAAGETHTGTMAAAAHASVQFEEVRRSMPSEGTPSHAAASAAAQGKTIRDSDRRTTLLIDGAEPDMEVDENYIQIASPKHGDLADDEALWAVRPCSIEWNKLRLNRKNWTNAPEGAISSGNNDAVLNNVSGSVKAGEFLVITGPSKDESLALLSCLAGYEDAMEGNVTVNGRQWNKKMDRYIAYIMREDLFYETLTVHEHLLTQAQLRMRRTHTDEMCLQRVEAVIEDMGLGHCRDELIGGGVTLRGISRGERKLLALATALLTNPSILLVEEPTDGLDTFSAETIVAKLRWLAFEKELTVAVTLHHPSSHFYGLFDVLYLVTDGSCVYDGKASDCVAYFSTIGYPCPEYMSPMDYFLLQMVVGNHGSDDEGVARVEMLKRQWSDRNAAVYADNEARAVAASEDVVVDAYDEKNRYYHMSCCGQLWLLWARHVRRLSRYGFVFWWHMLAALLIGVMFGLVYLQLDLDDVKGIQNLAGAFFYIVVIQMLFISYRTFVFMPREFAIALRERREYRGGWYHLLCWYLTKIIAELPALIILSIVLFVPVFLLVGIGYGFKTYVYMQIVIVLAGWAAVSLGFLVLAVLRKVVLAVIVYSVLLVLFVIFGGLMINVTDIPDWLVWLHYISPVKFGYEALMKIFWKRVDTIICDWTDPQCVAFTGAGVLKYYSMENRSALGDSLILLAICLGLFFVAFWFLLFLTNKRVSGFQWRYDWTFKGPLGGRSQRVGNALFAQKEGAVGSSAGKFIGRKSHHSSSAAAERSVVANSDNHYIAVETPRVGGHGICDAASITLGWSSLWLKAPVGKSSKVEGSTQQLISDASGSAKCGELMLITGPSSESNVALLESLGGLQKRVKGKITVNGVHASAQQIADRSVFIPRDDLFYETLTVEEHLTFQARLCVGTSGEGCGGFYCGSGDGESEAERVEMALEETELACKRHMLIRYLSPADVKLLAVATALLSNPSILLIEEPTDCLDFYSSKRVVLKLRQLAREGRTVVVSMAHPSSHEYALFDVLYLLAGGAAVYHGKVREAVSYFASLGYQCPRYMSPVDYFVRQVMPGNDREDGQVTLFKEAWSTRYSGMLCLDDDGVGEEALAEGAGHRRRVGCCGQLFLLFWRHVLRLRRYHVVFGWHAFWMIALGVIFGLIFLQLDLDDQQDIQNWVGAFFFIIVLQMLVVAYRTFVFLPGEMAVAEREHRGGKYYLVCWFVTKVVAELPALLILSILLFVPAYLLIGIDHGFKVYFYMQLVMWLAGWSAAGLATVLMGLFRQLRVALIVYALLFILFVVFGGLLVNVDDVPDYLIWLHYISPVKYGYEALMKLFWGRIVLLACGESDGSGSGSATFATVGDDSSFSMSSSGSADDGCVAHSGSEVLEHYSMDNSRTARSDTIILVELAVLYFFIGYAFLSLRLYRYKTSQRQHLNNSSFGN